MPMQTIKSTRKLMLDLLQVLLKILNANLRLLERIMVQMYGEGFADR